MKVLIDTNVYTAMMRGHREVAEIIRGAEKILFSTVVAGEIQFGFRAGSRFEKNMRELKAFLSNPYVDVLPVTMTTADRFSRIAADLRLRGTPIPSNDIWIAAQTMESGAELLSFDRYFERIDGLVWKSLLNS